MPDISFVIPVYNGEEYLSFALASCVGQDHKSIEIIPVDDGSTDSTRRIIAWYAAKDARIRPVFLDVNKGSGHARNAGTEAATSPYICMLDSDDEATKIRASETLKIIRGKGEGLIFGSCAYIDCLGRRFETGLSSEFKLFKVLDKENNKGIFTFIPHSSMCYPKSFWEKNHYDEDVYVKSALEDWKFQMDAAFSGYPIYHTEKILCCQRQNYLGQFSKRDEVKALALKEEFIKSHEAVAA